MERRLKQNKVADVRDELWQLDNGLLEIRTFFGAELHEVGQFANWNDAIEAWNAIVAQEVSDAAFDDAADPIHEDDDFGEYDGPRPPGYYPMPNGYTDVIGYGGVSAVLNEEGEPL